MKNFIKSLALFVSAVAFSGTTAAVEGEVAMGRVLPGAEQSVATHGWSE